MMGGPDDGFAGEQGEVVESVAEGTCLPLPALDWAGLGDWPVLGVVPAFVPADPVAWYPDGVVPAPRVLAADLPALRARFGRAPALTGAAAALQPVVDTLVDEAGAAWDRDRLARRLFALASLLRESEGSDDLALEALRCAVANEPDHPLARFALEAMLAAQPGAAVERVTLLEGASVADVHRAGHRARADVGDPAWALDLWWQAAQQHPDRLETLLASYLVHLESGDEQAAATLAEMLYQAAPGRRFWGVLSADRTARARPYWPIEQLRADVVATLARSGASPALLAVGEELAFSTGDHALARQLLEARIAEPGVEPEELGILWARLGWLLEEAGEEEAAREACEKAISYGNPPGYARRRALALARRQGSHALIHRLQSARAEDERLPAGERAAALVERAAADFALERAAEGRQALARAVELDRTCRPALAALGRAAVELDDTPGQLQLFGAELAALETQGDQPQRIADRAVRLALLRLRSGRELALALDACRRALAAVPGDRDAFLTGADVLARLGQWPALAALYARRAGQAGVGPEEAVEYLSLAADLFRGRLGDPGSAARLLAQAVRLLPTHGPTLARAAEVFALTGQRRAWAEAEARLGTPARSVRAGRLFEHGDATETEAAAAAFAAGGDDPMAIDGQVRASERLGDVTPLAAVPAQALTQPLVRLTVAEALLAGGQAEAALNLLPEGAIAPDNLSFYKGFLDLRAVAAAWTGRWATLASILVAQAGLVRGTPRAELLVRAGEVRALRDGDVAGAVELFRQALAADPECGAARAALGRWETAQAAGDGGPLVAAAAARRAGDWARHDATLREAAERETRSTEAEGLRRAEGQGALEAPPHRSDLFQAALQRVGDDTQRARLLGARVEVAAAGDRPELLRRRIMACLAAHDLKGCEDAARRLLALDPESLPAGLALARVAALTGQPAREGLAALAQAARAPANREALGVALAQVATDPLTRARAALAEGRLDEARALLAAAPPSVDAHRLEAEVAWAAGDHAAALAASTRAFEALEGTEAAAEALHIAERLRPHDPEGATRWLQRALRLDPRRASEAVAAEGWAGDTAQQVSQTIEARLAAGVLVPEELAELARLHHRRGDAVGAELARRAAVYVGAEVESFGDFALDFAQLEPSDWEAHVQVAAEATPTAHLLARLADPLAAALAGPPLPGLAGAERWQGEVAALFERLAVPRPRIGLAPDARWGGRLMPGPVVLAPAREAPLDEPARFYLGSLAAGFGRGRLLVQVHEPAVVAGGLAALWRGVSHDKRLISLEEALPVDRRARLVAAASGLEPADRAALAEAPEALFDPAQVAALVEPFQATARRAGLLACGDLTAALDVVLGRGGGSPRARRQALAASPPALALLAWALSADHRVLLGRKGAA